MKRIPGPEQSTEAGAGRFGHGQTARAGPYSAANGRLLVSPRRCLSAKTRERTTQTTPDPRGAATCFRFHAAQHGFAPRNGAGTEASAAGPAARAACAAGSPVEEHGDADLEEGPVDQYHVAAARGHARARFATQNAGTRCYCAPSSAIPHAKQALAGADARRSLPRCVSARLLFSDPSLRVFLVCV